MQAMQAMQVMQVMQVMQDRIYTEKGTISSCAIWWPNLELLQVEPPLAGEITQVLDAIPWVRCASGNVFVLAPPTPLLAKNLNGVSDHFEIWHVKRFCGGLKKT